LQNGLRTAWNLTENDSLNRAGELLGINGFGERSPESGGVGIEKHKGREGRGQRKRKQGVFAFTKANELWRLLDQEKRREHGWYIWGKSPNTLRGPPHSGNLMRSGPGR